MKQKLTLSIDEEVLQKVKKSGINISRTVENFLKYGVYFRPSCQAYNSGSNPGARTHFFT